MLLDLSLSFSLETLKVESLRRGTLVTKSMKCTSESSILFQVYALECLERNCFDYNVLKKHILGKKFSNMFVKLYRILWRTGVFRNRRN